MYSLFILFSTGAISSALIILRSKNPVHAVFYLVSVFLHSSGLLCLLGLEYFALLFLLVYIGALAIMFLFVVMLLDIPATEMIAYQRGMYPTAGLLVFFLTCLITVSYFMPTFLTNLQYSFQNPLIVSTIVDNGKVDWDLLTHYSNPVSTLGIALYGVHVDLLIIASLVLLVAMVGAVALTLKRRVSAPIYDIFAQHNRDFQKVVSSVKGSSIINLHTKSFKRVGVNLFFFKLMRRMLHLYI
jgi:NADH:ubiquinone oxidoreductase subunit 6 (subunit J)